VSCAVNLTLKEDTLSLKAMCGVQMYLRVKLENQEKGVVMIMTNEIDEILMLYKIKEREADYYKKQVGMYSELLKIKDQTIEVMNERIDLKDEMLSEL
jgi:histidinol phosphatase-like enzyme